MTHYFLDSSALAKRYIPEIGTGWVQAITGRLSGRTVMVAPITQVEVVSAAQRHLPRRLHGYTRRPVGD